MKSAKFIIIVSIAIMSLTSCQIWQNDGVSDISSTVSSQSESEILYNMITLGGSIYLKPDTKMSIKWAAENDAQMFYQLSVMKDKWIPVDYTIAKIGSVTGKRYNELSESTIDIYKIKIGNWTGYYRWSVTPNDMDVEYEILSSDLTDLFRVSIKAKDCQLLSIFDDIYRINEDDSIIMATSRVVGEYVYETIEKQSMGDLFAWQWTLGVYCIPGGSDVFYLTSRDGNFYSLWKLDLLTGIESKYTDDEIIKVLGIADQKLVVYLEQKTTDDTFGKMISLSDSSDWIEIDGKFDIMNNVIILSDGDEEEPDLTYNSNNIWINNIDEGSSLGAMIHGIDTLVLVVKDEYPTPYHFIDLGDMTCGSFYIDNASEITFADYTRMLEEIAASKVPIEDSDLGFVITQDMRNSGS